MHRCDATDKLTSLTMNAEYVAPRLTIRIDWIGTRAFTETTNMRRRMFSRKDEQAISQPYNVSEADENIFFYHFCLS